MRFTRVRQRALVHSSYEDDRSHADWLDVGVIIKSERQIAGLRKAGRLVAETYDVLREHVKPGVTTGELDEVAESYIRGHGAIPVYKGYNGLPERGSAGRNTAFPA